MSGTASGFSIGIGAVTVVYGSTTITINEVKDVEIDRSATAKMYYGDAGVFSRVLVMKEKKRSVKIVGAQLALLQSVPEDTPCTVSVVFLDARNGTGAGAITATLVNGVCTSNPYKGQATEFGSGDLMFEAFSSDGTTDPLTYSVAS